MSNLLLVGCPVQSRGWIMPSWLKAVQEARPQGWDMQFVFAKDKSDDSLVDFRTDRKVHIVDVKDQKRDYERAWNGDRYHHMAFIRNRLLDRVKDINPDLFLSLDSDILVHPEAITNMIATLVEKDDKHRLAACGGLTYLDETDPRITNAASLVGPNYRRTQTKGRPKVDVIMAIKLMNEKGFNTPYEWHLKGEDFGWSEAVRRNRCELVFDGRVGSKHVMNPYWLDVVDKRVGY